MDTYKVTLEVRHGGSAFGTVTENVSADSPEHAESIVLEQARNYARSINSKATFAPLVTVMTSSVTA